MHRRIHGLHCGLPHPGLIADRLVLQLLRPHLHEVYLDAERRRHGIPHLSRRELEVLQPAAQGFSNADIAWILFVSLAAVAKHMEHIFDRTGVRTRSAAALQRHEILTVHPGPVPGQPCWQSQVPC